MNDVLPEGWTSAALGDGLVADVQTGFASGKHNRGGAGIAHLRPMNVSVEGSLTLDNVKFVPKNEADRPERIVGRGDVIFNNTNSPELVGKTGYYDLAEPRAFSNHMTRVRCREHVLDSKYCALFLHQLWREGHFESICNNHVSQASVSRAALLATHVLLPPAPEQRRIVEEVEALIARVDATRVRLAHLPETLRRFRQSVLTSAFSENERAAAPWPLERAADVCSIVQSGGTPKGKPFTAAGDIPFIKTYNIVRQVVAFAERPQFIPRAVHEGELRRSIVRPGDVLMNIVGPPLGKVALVPDAHPEWNLNQALVLFRTGRSLDPHFLYYFLCEGREIRRIAPEYRGSAGQVNISLSQAREFLIPIPSMSEQQEVVRRVRSLLGLANGVERRIAAATIRADKLTQAILAKAFRGELVPTEAELARQGGREYETAEQLLERARRESAAGTSEPRRRGRRSRTAA